MSNESGNLPPSKNAESGPVVQRLLQIADSRTRFQGTFSDPPDLMKLIVEGPFYEHLKSAAEPVLDDIRWDLDRVEGKVEVLVDHIYNNLFDPDLNVNRLKVACKIRDNSVVMSFHYALGRPPKNYIQNARLRTARRLLRSPLRIWEIAELLGYSSLGVFSKAFERWEGVRPLRFRESEGTPTVHEDVCRRAWTGELTPEEASDLFDRLRAQYPEAPAWASESVEGPREDGP